MNGCGLVSGEWDKQQKIGWCMEDPSRQQRPDTDKRKKRRSDNWLMRCITWHTSFCAFYDDSCTATMPS